MKASLALGTRANEPHGGTYLKIEREDELRIARAVSDGLVEGILRLVILAVLIPVATVVFVVLCCTFPAASSDPGTWLAGAFIFFVLPLVFGRAGWAIRTWWGWMRRDTLNEVARRQLAREGE